MATFQSASHEFCFAVRLGLAMVMGCVNPAWAWGLQPDQPEPTSTGEIQSAVEKAVIPIERAMVGYRENRRCFSCHHHAHAIIALTEIAQRGIQVDRELLRIQFSRSVSQTRIVERRYQQNQDIGGGVDTTGYALLAMRTGGIQPDATTDAMVDWMLKRADASGSWKGTTNRAPTQTSDFTRTWLCLDALKYFGRESRSEEISLQMKKSREWLMSAEVTSTEDKTSRIRALSISGDAANEIAEYSNQLIKEQRDDGGWAQTDDLPSDAYATGRVLITLAQFAGRSTSEEFYRQGVGFLISTQLDDGTWHVSTRATPVQEYFESGFPHGRDQYISFTATCWAAMAAGLSLPRLEKQVDVFRPPLANIRDQQLLVYRGRFKTEIWPLIHDNGESSCQGCHNTKYRSGLRFSDDVNEDFQRLLDQHYFHPTDPAGMLFSLTSQDPKLMMPPGKRPRLSPEQIESVRKFVQDLYGLQKSANQDFGQRAASHD